ncbi:Os08g0557850, partial [Oryza sativa Japonica Group]
EAGDGLEEVHLLGGDDLAALPNPRLLREVPPPGLVQHRVRRRVPQRRAHVVHRRPLLPGLAGVRHRRRHHRVHHHVPRDDVHHQVQVAQEARQVLLRVPDDERVDRPRPLHPPRHRVPLDARDDARPHHHHAAGAGDRRRRRRALQQHPGQHHLAHGLGEDVGVGPPEVARPGEPQLLHRLPPRLVVVVFNLPTHVGHQPKLRVHVQVHPLSQRPPLLERPLLD